MGKTYFRRDKYEQEDIEQKKHLNRKALRQNKNSMKEFDEFEEFGQVRKTKRFKNEF